LHVLIQYILLPKPQNPKTPQNIFENKLIAIKLKCKKKDTHTEVRTQA